MTPTVADAEFIPAAWHERFTDRYRELPSGCWEFTGYIAPNGYGHIVLDGQVTTAHRASSVLAFGPIQDGHVVMHECDNPPCIRPHHLRPAPPSQNTRDMVRKRRHGAVTKPWRVSRGPTHHWYGVSRWGEKSTSAKLTWPQIREMRALRAEGTSVTDLMRRFGVGRSQTCAILRGESWPEEHDPAKAES